MVLDLGQIFSKSLFFVGLKKKLPVSNEQLSIKIEIRQLPYLPRRLQRSTSGV